MATITWSDSLSVKIESIDNQHKELFNLINKFYEGLKNEEKHANLIKLVYGLRDYTVYHFNKEEQLMKKHDYPEFEKHKKEHAFFINAVKDYIDRINSGKLLISIEITNFIKDWISNHIANVDKAYSDFFIKKGVN
jgi:hemerythrin